MKIAILTPTFYSYDGVARVAKRQAEEYSAAGHDVTIFTMEGNMSAADSVVQVIGSPSSRFLRRIYWLFFPIDIFKHWKYGRLLKNYDKIVSHEYPISWLAFWAKKFNHVRYTYHAHGLTSPTLFKSLYERAYMQIFHFFWKKTIVNADSVVCVSRYLQEELKAKYHVDSQVIYNTYDESLFNVGVDGTNIRVKYQLGNSPVILFVGRLDPYKGVHILLDIFQKVKEKIFDARLIIVGQPTYRNYMNKLYSKVDPSVIIAGLVGDDELPSYYASCNVYATASLFENFNIPLVEAQACGKPVVAFDIRSHPEVVERNVTGILIKPGNTVEFVEAIIRILRDTELASSLGRAGATRARKTFGTVKSHIILGSEI